MSLRLEVTQRNYELERLKAKQKPRAVRDHPLMNQEGSAGRGGFGGGAAQLRIDTNQAAVEEDKNSDDEGGIEEKIKAVSTLFRVS